MADRPHIEYELREPTGLGLGTYDIFLIRQKIYEGALKPATQFQTPDGKWHGLATHPAFEEVFWALGVDPDAIDNSRKRAAFGGWKTSGSKKQERVKIESTEKRAGLLGRFFGKKG